MCTVTFLPLGNNNFILTSNRDESKSRETLAPKKYSENGVGMVYPKDKLAGGTWIGASSKKRLVCVLNGAFEKHKRKPSYGKSRGVLAKEILKTDNLIDHNEQLNLIDIEPFTMVILDWSNTLKLYELIWDGDKKHFRKLKREAKIWSSSTLYASEIKTLREKWFEKWKSENDFTENNILDFHHSEFGDKEQSILMKRPYVETVSISMVKKQGDDVVMLYEDVVNAAESSIKL